ncbi:hypothetical protein [Solilutibacter silvestris]|uniref:hypothetical protein n=1 Tax=Solilutibacter silvestris TaxID=1645665 RepID=UPI003D357019
MTKFLALLLATILLAGCRNGSTSLEIQNQSPIKLESVQAYGPGFEAYVGNLEPGERTKIKIYPHGEAGVGLSFTAKGQNIKSPVSGYFEGGGGYKVLAVVTKDFSVDIDARL